MFKDFSKLMGLITAEVVIVFIVAVSVVVLLDHFDLIPGTHP
jgi:hypothetical protein